MLPTDPRQIAQELSQLKSLLRVLAKKNKALEQAMTELAQTPRSIEDEINQIPGRRIESALVGISEDPFTVVNAGLRGLPITMNVSQDGPFIWTHYPLVMWLPVEPTTATNFGRWSPVSTWPLPTQEAPTGDIIDISYEIEDQGNQRNFQNMPRPPLLSRPDNVVPLPVPTLLAPNSNTAFVPTFRRIFFDPAAAVPTTAGELHVFLPGFRIVNL